MVERDYIKRLVQLFLEALEKLVEKTEAEPFMVEQELKSMYMAYFGKPESYFYQTGADGILGFLTEAYAPEERLFRIEMLAELFFRDAVVKTSVCEKRNLLQKSLFLFGYLDAHSDTFSFERRKKMEEISRLLE